MSEVQTQTLLKVGAESNPRKVATALAGVLTEQDGFVELQAVGAGAVNQTVKAIAIARGLLAPTGVEIASTPSFVEIDIEGSERTAIRFKVFAVGK